MKQKTHLFLFFIFYQISFAQTTLIKAGKFYNSETNKFEKNIEILISGKIITQVGKNLKIPAGKQAIFHNRICHTYLFRAANIPHNDLSNKMMRQKYQRANRRLLF